MSYADEIFRQIAASNAAYKASLDEGAKIVRAAMAGSEGRALRRLIQRVAAFERDLTLTDSLPMHRIAELREALTEAKEALK